MKEEDIEEWQRVFQEQIQEVKPWHKWTITVDKDLLPDVLKPGWTQYQQKAFARFHCPLCFRSWASGRVLMVFHMRWCEEEAKGRVKMRAFAQRCSRCPEPPFAAPEFTEDNISRILNNLILRLLKKCYREEFQQTADIPLLEDTSLEGPHDSKNCEACVLGFCAQSGLGKASKPAAPPLSPTSKSTREPEVTAACSNMPSSQPSSKVERPQASGVNPKAIKPTKVDPKVSHTSKPSTVPIVTTQPLSFVSSPTPIYVIDMPYPIKSSRAAKVTNQNLRSKTSKPFPPSSSCVPPTSSSFIPPTSFAAPTSISHAGHSSLRLPANTTYQAELRSHSYPQREPCCEGCCEGCCECRGGCCEGCCRCCGDCCEGCCECCGGCCKAFLECMSENPCCRRLVFIMFFVIVAILVIQYGL